MDNRVFNVNGEGLELLTATLDIAFRHSGGRPHTAIGYGIVPAKGLILYWADGTDDFTRFPAPMTAEKATIVVWEWLQTTEIKASDSDEDRWDYDPEDSDVSVTRGWRAYCEDWGHVAGHYQAIVAVKPVALWHGK